MRDAVAAVVWLALSVIASVQTLAAGWRPWALVLAGAALAFVAPDRDRPGWSGMLAASLMRIADTLLFAAIAWSLGRHDADVGGAAAASALLAAALLSGYVRVRATSLGIASPLAGAPVERGVRLLLTGIGLAGPLVPMLWATTGLTLALAAVRSAGVWRHA